MIRMIVATLLFYCLNICYADDEMSWKEIKIPMQEAGSQGLEAIIVYPNDGLKHPLALISHGSPRDATQRPKMSALAFLPIAQEFARRGFSAAVVLRRGYGGSGGGWVEGYGSCDQANYSHSAQMASQDLHAAIDYLSQQPEFDTSKMIAVGVSAGGFATVALTAINPPPGLKAAISFAGGRGSQANNKVCQEDKLITTFADLGKTSRIPMLWVYAKNDHFFNPSLAQKLYKAFTANGGNAEFIAFKPYGDEGHFLFSNEGIAEWTPLVEVFLKKQNLVLVDEFLPVPQSASLKAPASLSAKAKLAFKKYIIAAPHKAFAVASDGGFGWRSGQRDQAAAKEGALGFCSQYAASGCHIIAVDDQMQK